VDELVARRREVEEPLIDFEPTEEQRLIVDTVRQFAANEIRPAARDACESRTPPKDALAQAHELGLVAHGLEEAYGGGGERNAVTGALIAEELAFGDLAIALAILSPGLLGLPVNDFGTEVQKREILPTLLADHFVPGSLALSEPSFQFDPFRPATRARRDGDEYVLTGEKCFVPWLDGGDSVLVVASEGESCQAFLVPRSAARLTVTPERNMGIDALPTVELALDDVRVPAAARLGGEAGIDHRELINRGRVGLAAAAVGVARSSFEIARDYAKERETFGAPIATRQSIAFMLADMAIEIDASRLLVWEAAWCLDQGGDATRETTLASQQAARVARVVTDGAVQVLGGHGYIRDYLPEMHLRNASGFANFESLLLV
jgi:alkylation response protein AidB-like acyl-CoA dehydrogenase